MLQGRQASTQPVPMQVPGIPLEETKWLFKQRVEFRPFSTQATEYPGGACTIETETAQTQGSPSTFTGLWPWSPHQILDRKCQGQVEGSFRIVLRPGVPLVLDILLYEQVTYSFHLPQMKAGKEAGAVWSEPILWTRWGFSDTPF